MELWLANIKTTKQHPIQEILSQVSFDEETNCFTAFEYDGTIVVKATDERIKSIYVSHYSIKSKFDRIPLLYDKHFDVWFDKGDVENDRAPVGINQCGTFFFEAENENGLIIERTKDILVSSNLLTEEDYQQMKDEIAHIIGDLVSAKGGPVHSLQYRQDQLGRLDKTIIKLEIFKEMLEEIEKSPHVELKRDEKLIHYSKIKRHDMRTLMEKRLFPFKEKFLVQENVQSTDIIEHGMIRWGLGTILQDYDRYLKMEQIKKREMRTRINDLNSSQESLLNRDYYPNGEDLRRIQKSINNDLKSLNSNLFLIAEAEIKLQEIKKILESCLGIPILNGQARELEKTHLFTFSSLYSQVFNSLTDLVDEKNNKKVVAVYQSLQKSPELYENWCLLSIIHTLIYRCGFIPLQNPFSKIQYYIDHSLPLEGIQFSFKRLVYRSTNSVLHDHFLEGRYIFKQQEYELFLELSYERIIEGAEKPYKPDYTFKFTAGNLKKFAFLDAKYKPFNEFKTWMDHITEVSYIKYYRTLPAKPVASFLMHPMPLKDSTVNNWNAATNRLEEYRHLFGSFDYSPNNQKGFLKWMNMIVHYHLGFDGVCFHCGTELSTRCESFEGQSWKKYHTCQNADCEAFWVKSNCFNRTDGKKRLENAHSKESSTLFKYTKHSKMNYHKETALQWDVECPVCHKSAKDLRKR